MHDGLGCMQPWGCILELKPGGLPALALPLLTARCMRSALRSAMRATPWPAQVPLGKLTTPSAGLFPEFEHFEVFAGARPDAPYRRAPPRAASPSACRPLAAERRRACGLHVTARRPAACKLQGTFAKRGAAACRGAAPAVRNA